MHIDQIRRLSLQYAERALPEDVLPSGEFTTQTPTRETRSAIMKGYFKFYKDHPEAKFITWDHIGSNINRKRKRHRKQKNFVPSPARSGRQRADQDALSRKQGPGRDP